LAKLGILPFNSGNRPPDAECFQSLNMALFGSKSLRRGLFSGIFLEAAKYSFTGCCVLISPPRFNVQIA
jgi:hypothetical protein